MILIAFAAAAPALYNDDELRIVGGLTGRAPLVSWANTHQRQTGARYRVDGQDVPPKKLSYQELLLAQMAANDGAASEYDLFVPTPDGPRATSLSIQGDVWVLSTGTPAPVAPLDLEVAVARVGLRPLGTKPWEADVAQAVCEALALLSDAEIRALRGVGLQRVAGTPRDDLGPSAATYHGEGVESRIEVYDPAARPTVRFVGEPSRPYHPASLVILHEVAHAIADAPIRALLAEHARRRTVALKNQALIASDIEAHNVSVRAHNTKPVAGGAEALAQQGSALQARSAALRIEIETLNRAVKRLQESTGTSPIGAAFAREIGKSPTHYGMQSPDEAFAEAFALYRLDPAVLERVVPGAVAWFERGMHTAAP